MLAMKAASSAARRLYTQRGHLQSTLWAALVAFSVRLPITTPFEQNDDTHDTPSISLFATTLCLCSPKCRRECRRQL